MQSKLINFLFLQRKPREKSAEAKAEEYKKYEELLEKNE